MKPGTLYILPILFAVLAGGATVQTARAQDELPTVFNVTRDKGIPTSTESVTVTMVRAPQSLPIAEGSVRLCFAADGGEPQCVDAVKIDDTTYSAVIPPQSPEALVTYWVTSRDADQTPRTTPDKIDLFKFYYVVIDDRISIYDIQNTPNLIGTSGMLGFEVTVDGVVTADTSDIIADPAGSTPPQPIVVIQDGRSMFSGISILVRNSNGEIIPEIAGLKRGDKVRVTGTIEEPWGITALADATVSVSTDPAPTFQPVYLPSGRIAMKKEGESKEGEGWESMLVEYQDLVVVDAQDPHGSGEFTVVDRYTEEDPATRTTIETDNSDAGYTTGEPGENELKMREGWTFQYVRGIVLQHGQNYRLVPRDREDYKASGSPVPAGMSVSNAVVNVTPNPGTDRIAIELDLRSPGSVAVQLFGLTGEQVAERRLDAAAGRQSVTFETSGLEAGVYMVRAVGDDGIIGERTIVIR